MCHTEGKKIWQVLEEEKIIAINEAIGSAIINPASFGYCPGSQLANEIKLAAINILTKNNI